MSDLKPIFLCIRIPKSWFYGDYGWLCLYMPSLLFIFWMCTDGICHHIIVFFFLLCSLMYECSYVIDSVCLNILCLLCYTYHRPCFIFLAGECFCFFFFVIKLVCHMHIQIIVTAIVRYFTCITEDTIKRHKQTKKKKKG